MSFFTRNTLVIAIFLTAVSTLHAFPPAPYYTIFGDVRNQYGMLLPANGTSVILYEGSREVLRQPLVDSGTAPYNYQIRMRIDMFRPSTATYSSLALRSGTNYTLAVNIGGQLFSPIEMRTTPSVGSPADRRRLDLTLGIDSDGDGIPDAWKEAQLFHAGIEPGPDGWDLSLIDRDGDFNGDGISNWHHYIAGTYATIPGSFLKLEIINMVGSFPKLQFYAIYGKSYTLEHSEDLKNWQLTEFAMEDPVPVEDPESMEEPASVEFQSSHKATNTGILSIYPEATTPATFYRIIVR
ncbi:MAG: hypothetical protein JJU20_10765 [Opitutales bacterium]|nr:hypothetical protein [Opitutales bacterium]